MKRTDLIGLYNTIESMLKNSKKLKLNFQLIEAKKVIYDKIGSMENLLVPSDEFKTFDSKRVNLCEEYAEKEEDGTPKMDDNKYVGLDGNVEFTSKFDELRSEYSEAIAEYESQQREYFELLNENVEIEFKKIDVDLIPDDLITGKQLEDMSPILDM